MQESNRSVVLSLLESKSIKEENIDKVLHETGVIPSSHSWYLFIDKLLLWFGGLALAFSLMFFVAYNWTEFGRFAKFALVEGALVCSVALYWYLGGEKLSAKVVLMVSSILVGVLLALVGQTYQTGADTWQLFFYWAILILPWVLVGHFSALWMLWILLINISILLYVEIYRGLFGFAFYSEYSLLWIFSIFNTAAWLLWEYFSTRYAWLNSTWALRVLGFVSMTAVTSMNINFLWQDQSLLSLLVWFAWLASVYWAYRVKKVDLFMLSLMALSFSTVVVSYLIYALLQMHFNLGSILLIGLVIIGLGAGFASWLKSVQKEAEDANE
jgi:uncharacterized membrane protein